MNHRDRIDADADVRAIARGLRISQERDLGAAIRDVAVGRIEAMLTELHYEPASVEDLREAVHHHTGLHVVRIESDDDLEVVQRDYADELRGLPKQLAFEFGTDTEALVVRRPTKDARSNRRFLALVDARGDRGLRAWFAGWHESGHTLVPDPANNLVLRRTKRARPEPVEQVIDLVASSLGFWTPIVKPVLLASLASGIGLLEAFEMTRVTIAPAASKEASFRAFVNLIPTAVVILWVDYDCRAADRRPGGNPMNSLALRAKTVIRNDAAIARGMNVPDNYRVPSDSVISTAANDSSTTHTENDDLGRWKDSTGRTLRSCPVKITARRGWAVIEAA